MFWLLVALILTVLLSPIIDMYGESRHRLYLALLTLFLLISAVHAVSVSRIGRVVGIVLATVWIILAWFHRFSDAPNATLWSDVPLMILLFYVLVTLVARTVSLKETNFDSLCGAVAAYFLIAATWGTSYRVIEALTPGSFAISGQNMEPAGSHWLYFSLTTITTLGYGDITPVSPFARMWSTLEATAGVLYIALLIARLISLYRS